MGKSSGGAPQVDAGALLNQQAELNRINQITPFGSVYYGTYGTRDPGTPDQPLRYPAPVSPTASTTGAAFPWETNYNAGVSPGNADVPSNAAQLLAQRTPQPAPVDTFTPTNVPGQPENFQTVSDVTQVTQYSPEVQALIDSQIGTATGLANQAGTVAAGLPTSPFAFDESGNRSRVEQAIFDRAKGLLDPVFARQEETLRDRLANAGQLGNEFINPGGRQDLGLFNKERAGAYENAALDAIIQGEGVLGNEFGRALATRSQPYNELAALLQGSQINIPMPNNQIQPIDVTGPNQLQQNAALAKYNAGQQNDQALMSGLMALGSAAILAFSDRRLKTDIRKVGKTDEGLPVYTYRYKAGGPVQMGVMADELEKVRPEAVAEIDGYKAVNYGMVQ